ICDFISSLFKSPLYFILASFSSRLTSAFLIPSIFCKVFSTLALQWLHDIPSTLILAFLFPNIFSSSFLYEIFLSSFFIVSIFSLYSYSGLNFLSLNEFNDTNTDDMLIAKAANIGDKVQPFNGYNNPAASGMPMIL